MESNSELVLSCGLRGHNRTSLCRCICRRVQSSVITKHVTTKRRLPSGHTFTDRLKVDIVAVRGTCDRLLTRNCVYSVPQHNCCTYRLPSTPILTLTTRNVSQSTISINPGTRSIGKQARRFTPLSPSTLRTTQL